MRRNFGGDFGPSRFTDSGRPPFMRDGGGPRLNGGGAFTPRSGGVMMDKVFSNRGFGMTPRPGGYGGGDSRPFRPRDDLINSERPYIQRSGFFGGGGDKRPPFGNNMRPPMMRTGGDRPPYGRDGGPGSFRGRPVGLRGAPIRA